MEVIMMQMLAGCIFTLMFGGISLTVRQYAGGVMQSAAQ